MPADQDYTVDAMFDGKLQCLQHRHGYRFSIDAVLLSHFISPKSGERILDLGAGCGIVSLILAYRYKGIHCVTLEIQPRLAALIHRNLELNDVRGMNFTKRMKVITGDLRCIEKYIDAGSFDRVVCNPPYRKSATGRLNPESEQALARHELVTDIEQLISAVCYALRTRGKAALIYPASRGVSLLYEMRKQGLEPKRLQMIHSYPGSDARLLLIEAIKGGGEELRVMPPFYVYQQPDGDYSAEMARCYEP